MNKRLLHGLTGLILACMMAGIQPAALSASTTPQTNCMAFNETGKSVCGKFFAYWNTHGGLPQQGYPISAEMQERSDTDGKTYTVQYFERAVFELHPENAGTPHDVLLSLLGNFRYNQKYSAGVPNQTANTAKDSVLFKETGKRLGGPFLDYWKSHGGLPQQGYPISDEFEERSDLNGKTYHVQYFERAVFEYHPENQQPYSVLLSQLGTFRYRAKYSAQAPSPTSTLPTSSPAALAYLNQAYDYIHENSIMRDRVNWPLVRQEALQLSQFAQTPADTYGAIAYILRSLGDGHSQFLTPEAITTQIEVETLGMAARYADLAVTSVTGGGLAEKAGVHVGDVITTINSEDPRAMGASGFFSKLYSGTKVDLTLVRTVETGEPQHISVTIAHKVVNPLWIPQGRRLDGNVGYINLPGNSGSPVREQYASITQQIIRDIDQMPTCGWIVDLQQNFGGNMHPMVMGIGPVVGDGLLGSFIDANGDVTNWSYQNGTYHNGTLVLEVDNPYQLKRPMPPVAVLTSPVTASSGEATLISFRGRPQTRSFGEPTYGVPSGNSGKTMSDGALIILTTALEADRTGRVYGFNEKIQPDEHVMVESLLFGKDNDPVMRKGLEWLHAQAGCAK